MKVGERKLFCLFPRINFLLLILFQLVSITTLSATPEWTFLVYVQANNNLSSFAEKNFTDMATIGSGENLNILVEWHQPNHPGVWRYKIDRRKMVFDSCTQPESDGNSPQDLVQAMQWAKNKYPANKYALVLWNHAIGIIDPKWGKYPPRSQDTLVDPLVVKENPRIQIEGLTFNKNDSSFLPAYLAPDISLLQETRGILFNETSKTYMTNQILTTALSEIKTNVLGGKKLDLLGMDACLMAMVEVGYQARNYAHILVASEEVELAHGWHYSSVLSTLKNNALTPAQLAQAIVLTYDNYYHDKVQFYTQSAIKLENMDLVKQALDNVVIALSNCQKISTSSVKNLIKKARSTCLQFSAPNYIDLNSFLSELLKQINVYTAKAPISDSFESLKKEILICSKIVEGAIIANSVGKNMGRASGLSIYYPTLHIDDSYLRTEFAKESLWLAFLQNTITA